MYHQPSFIIFELFRTIILYTWPSQLSINRM